MLKVIGIGDNVVDKYLHTSIMYPGGNALNFSVFAKNSGYEAAYLGSFGNDYAAKHIIAVLNILDIDTSRCRHLEGENGFSRVKIQNGDRVFVPGNSGGVMREYPLVFSTTDLDYIKAFELIHSSCYSYIEQELPKLRDTKVPISYDFSNRIDTDYLKAVCPYVDFAFFSAGDLEDPQAVEAQLSQMHDMGCSVNLATLGKEGAIMFDGQRYYSQPAESVDVVDTMGAGDAFITTFLLHYMEQCNREPTSFTKLKELIILDSLKKASKAAADTCQVDGSFGFGIPFSDEQQNMQVSGENK